MHRLSVHMLGDLLQRYPAIVVSEFNKIEMSVSRLFPAQGDFDAASMLLHNLLWTKQAMGLKTRSETAVFEGLLMRQTSQWNLQNVPACSARAWLVKIWKDVPSSRPNSDFLVRCIVRWLGEPSEIPAVKATCLDILREEAGHKQTADLEAWTLSLIFQEVCRNPAKHSADLQQLLWPSEEHHIFNCTVLGRLSVSLCVLCYLLFLSCVV